MPRTKISLIIFLISRSTHLSSFPHSLLCFTGVAHGISNTVYQWLYKVVHLSYMEYESLWFFQCRTLNFSNIQDKRETCRETKWEHLAQASSSCHDYFCKTNNEYEWEHLVLRAEFLSLCKQEILMVKRVFSQAKGNFILIILRNKFSVYWQTWYILAFSFQRDIVRICTTHWQRNSYSNSIIRQSINEKWNIITLLKSF